MTTCRTCKQATTWAEFEKSGKRALFDRDKAPTKEGELRWVLFRDKVSEPGSVVRARQAKVGEQGVFCHFATCPDADHHRRVPPKGVNHERTTETEP